MKETGLQADWLRGKSPSSINADGEERAVVVVDEAGSEIDKAAVKA